jgi:hypothetical protein
MDAWEKYELHLRRQAKFARINAWLLAHPYQSWSLTLGGVVLIFELSQFLRLGLDAVAAWLAS